LIEGFSSDPDIGVMLARDSDADGTDLMSMPDRRCWCVPGLLRQGVARIVERQFHYQPGHAVRADLSLDLVADGPIVCFQAY
jgi:hypothetical protein